MRVKATEEERIQILVLKYLIGNDHIVIHEVIDTELEEKRDVGMAIEYYTK